MNDSPTVPQRLKRGALNPNRTNARQANAALKSAGGVRLGRPARQLDPVAREAVLTAFRSGADAMTASGLAGVSFHVLQRWIVENEEFCLDIQKSRAVHVQDCLARLRILPAGKWQSAAWELERIYPERFGQGSRPDFAGAVVRVEVSATVCAEMTESWQRFKAQAIEPKEFSVAVTHNTSYVPLGQSLDATSLLSATSDDKAKAEASDGLKVAGSAAGGRA